jgi:hypothetical protein
MRQTIVCDICKGEIQELWQLTARHVHWTPSPRNTGLKGKIQGRMRHYGWLRTRQGRR